MKAIFPSKLYCRVHNETLKSYLIKFCAEEGIKFCEEVPTERILHEVFFTDNMDEVTMGHCIYVYYEDLPYKKLMECCAVKFLRFKEETTFDEVVTFALYTGSLYNRTKMKATVSYKIEDEEWYENDNFIFNFNKRVCIKKSSKQSIYLSHAAYYYIYQYAVKSARLRSYTLGTTLRRKWGVDFMKNIRRCENENYRYFIS